MFQTQQCGGGDSKPRPKAPRSRRVETLENSKEKAGMYGHSVGYKCTSQEMDANALAKAIDPKMQLCLRMGNPENATRGSRQGIIRTDKRMV